MAFTLKNIYCALIFKNYSILFIVIQDCSVRQIFNNIFPNFVLFNSCNKPFFDEIILLIINFKNQVLKNYRWEKCRKVLFIFIHFNNFTRALIAADQMIDLSRYLYQHFVLLINHWKLMENTLEQGNITKDKLLAKWLDNHTHFHSNARECKEYNVDSRIFVYNILVLVYYKA